MERGEFEIALPPAHLRPFVRRYLYANRRLQSGVVFHAKPTGYTYLTNFFGQIAGNYGWINRRRFDATSRWFFLGQIAGHELHFHHEQSLELIVCELTATGHQRLFGIPGRRVVGLVAPLTEVAPNHIPLARKCFILGKDAGRNDHVMEGNAFFSLLAEYACPADPIVEQAVNLLEGSHGTARVAEICEQLDVGRRELHRRFTRVVGLNPKFFGQIMQMKRMVDLLYDNGNGGLAQLAQEAGFYDQAHFNRAMQRFFREAPRSFLRARHPAYRSFIAQLRHTDLSPSDRGQSGKDLVRDGRKTCDR
jgi:AraC-like DNA-binding protein